MLDKCDFSGGNYVTKARRNMTGQSNWVLPLEKQNHLLLLTLKSASEKTEQRRESQTENKLLRVTALLLKPYAQDLGQN